MKLIKTANKTKIKLSKKEWTDIGKKAGWFSKDTVPTENEYGYGLDQEAMDLLKRYDIKGSNLWRFDDPSSKFQDIYEGIQEAKNGNNEVLRKALENRFGGLGFLRKKMAKTEKEMGIEVEKEHKDIFDALKKKFGDKMPWTLEEFSAKIAKAHLEEFSDYYTRLKKMEDEAKRDMA